MNLRALTLRHAVLVWATVSVGVALGPGYAKVDDAWLARYLPTRTEELAPLPATQRALGLNRAAARLQVTTAQSRLHARALFDSLRPSTNAFTLDVRLREPYKSEVEAHIRRVWTSRAATPLAVPVVVAVRDLDFGRGSAVEMLGGACKVVIYAPGVERNGLRGQPVMYRASTLRDLGGCLFAARYGTPGAAAVSLLQPIDFRSGPPCFDRTSMVPMYRCRILNTDANVQTVSMAVRYYRFTSVHHIACGGGNRAACAAWAADTLAPNTSAREYEESLRIRFLELDLKPQAFARFWKDSRPPAQAYEAIAGRPYEEFLIDRAAPGPFRYRPGPMLRRAELAFASLVIMLAVALGVVSARRRIGVNA